MPRNGISDTLRARLGLKSRRGTRAKGLFPGCLFRGTSSYASCAAQRVWKANARPYWPTLERAGEAGRARRKGAAQRIYPPFWLFSVLRHQLAPTLCTGLHRRAALCPHGRVWYSGRKEPRLGRGRVRCSDRAVSIPLAREASPSSCAFDRVFFEFGPSLHCTTPRRPGHHHAPSFVRHVGNPCTHLYLPLRHVPDRKSSITQKQKFSHCAHAYKALQQPPSALTRLRRTLRPLPATPHRPYTPRDLPADVTAPRHPWPPVTKSSPGPPRTRAPASSLARTVSSTASRCAPLARSSAPAPHSPQPRCSLPPPQTDTNNQGQSVTTLWRAIRANKEDRVAKLEWAPNGGLGRAIIGKVGCTCAATRVARSDCTEIGG